MKKIALLLMLQFSLLISADFVFLNNGKITPQTTTTTTSSQSTGVVRNSVSQIWADMHNTPTAWPAATSAGHAQFQGAVIRNAQQLSFPAANIWIEVEEEGNGNTCSHSINQSVNTRVEVGSLRGWYLTTDGKWHSMGETKAQTGKVLPGGILYDGERSCYDPYFNNARRLGSTSNVYRLESSSGFKSIKPQYYWRYHGWLNRTNFPNPSAVKAIYGQVHMRLILANPNGVDDRNKAHFVAHIASDQRRADGTYINGMGMSRYKKVTNNWQPFNFMTYITKAQLEANPPPISQIP